MTKCRGAESNRPHRDFQSRALPTELPRHWLYSMKKLNHCQPPMKYERTKKGTASIKEYHFLLMKGPS